MLDALLSIYLIIIFPCYKLWTNHHKNKNTNTRMHRYIKTIVLIALPLAALLASYWSSGRAPDALGLDVPVSRAGQWGIIFALALLIALAVAGSLRQKSLTDKKRIEYLALIKNDELMPRTHGELWTFAIATLFIGVGWEILYRGFLLSTLPPMIGTAGAVVLSALAYGAAHGYKNPRQLTASILAALLFALAFCASKSLWWLMLVHIGLPFIGAVSSFNLLREDSLSGNALSDSERQPIS
ncbi:CPBP family intramembrane glutamic endopeptidase [Janthinobacterium sp.]|uniref:CPBP family intramembrane glutamic endopeptidase n=1 Tax=Janthinobacterium sp. TaxID=1871054 RepID=UPI00293D9C91|nr:CPBP family intramembrane glutamic endopeptidase [Janthinobacterium sp.]